MKEYLVKYVAGSGFDCVVCKPSFAGLLLWLMKYGRHYKSICIYVMEDCLNNLS